MRLEVKDQIHVSWVQADSLRPGDKISVTAEEGEALMKAHPNTFKQIAKSTDSHGEKAEPAILNKMEAGPSNKAAKKAKGK